MTFPSSAPIIDPDAPLPWEPGYDGGPIVDGADDDAPASDAPHDRESDAPEVLEAWYGPFGFFEAYRKVTLSECKEIVRASNGKLTEARLDALAHTHPLYLDFLARHLDGRTKREAMVRRDQGMV